MRISRHGYAAYHGQSNVEFPSPAISWLKADSCIAIKQSDVKDFSTDAHHSYTASLTVNELNGILKALAEAALADPTSFEKGFHTSLKALVQLQAVVAGVKT